MTNHSGVTAAIRPSDRDDEPQKSRNEWNTDCRGETHCQDLTHTVNDL
jgi:hypothetical protein